MWFNAVDPAVRESGEFHSCCNSSQQSSSTTRYQHYIRIFHLFQYLKSNTATATTRPTMTI